MGLVINNFVFSIIITIWILNTSVTNSCPEICKSEVNKTTCSPTLYKISLKESGISHDLQVCCNEEFTDILRKKFIKTYTQVSVAYTSLCNSTMVEFDFPMLSTYAITMTNNNISRLKMNIKSNVCREINLSFNDLKYINGEIFTGFTNLRQLILRKNQIKDISEDSFIGLTKLETLDLSENHLTVLTNVFTPLKNLQHLNISRNKLEFLKENYFNNWLLQHLDISHNNLRAVAPGALQHLPNLARLLLTDNPHLGITSLDTQLLVGTGRRLQQIDASRTGLYQVPEAFTHSVRFLSLVGNNITSLRCGDLDSYPLLQSLDFSDNKISCVEDDSIGRLEMLLFLNLNKNNLNIVPKSLPDELKYLSFNDNLIKNLSKSDFKNLPNLKILLLKTNLISFIEDHVFDDLLSLEMLDLSNNPIQMLSSSTFDGPLSLRDLRLCFLNISMPEIDGSFPMSSPESIQMLHLKSSPGLARQLLADSAALAAFSHLQYLDLRMNNISEIRSDLLFYLVELKTLRLHGNKLLCNNETWLNDWMNWNRNSSGNETCYYSTPEAKLEMNKYNCTFPETFTISESLPPVNLYSTEMINKLLRYYGYLYNKTDKFPAKHNNSSSVTANGDSENSSSIHDRNITNGSQIKLWNKYIVSDFDKNETISQYNGSILSSIKSLKEREHVNVNKDVIIRETDQTHQNIKSYDPFEKNVKIDSFELSDKNKLTTKITYIPASSETNINDRRVIDRNNTEPRTNTNFTLHSNNLLKFSPYQSVQPKYAEYLVTIGTICLVVIAFILWVSFRLRYKRRQMQEMNSSLDDQIEVSNISGGVLW